ncbi:MAG: MerR family DNA-binding transcriptional regulator [Nitrospira sp. WS110]|nr:MerR family DNA-binding transcriptional regulator [Nitrospira sp. WS110]
MRKNASTLNLKDYLTVGEAAEALGVSRSTLRNWDKAGKLKPYRHPVNGYRLYKQDELKALLQEVETNR